MPSVIDQIDRALDMTAKVVAGVRADQLAQASPCHGWTVRDELSHLVGGIRIYVAELTGTDAGAGHEADWVGADPQAAFDTAAALDRAAWHRPDVLASTVRLSFATVPGPMAALVHLTELLVHGVDLAVVTDQEHAVDRSLCAELLAAMRAMDFSAFRRPGMFGPEVPPPAGAPAHRQLLAFLGRDLPSR